MVGKKSIQLPIPCSKTGFSSRSLIIRLKRSSETAPKEVFLE